MRALHDADNFPAIIEIHKQSIEVLESRIGSLNISAREFEGFGFGWRVWPEDESLVMVFDGYALALDGFNWGPGSGPCRYLAECLDSLRWNLDNCSAVIVGKCGPWSQQIPVPEFVIARHEGAD